MKRLHERGFAHLTVAIVVAVLTVGATGLLVLNKQGDSAKKNQTTSSSASTPQSDKETTQPAPVATAPEVEEKEAPSDLTPAPSAPAPQKRTISFVKGGGSQDGDYVHVKAYLSEEQTGTCTFSFSLNGTERVRETSSISSTKICGKYVPLSSFPKSANYSFVLNFLSSDGLVSADQAPYDIEVH